MTKAVFTTKINPTYDDLPEDRYHFPRTYLKTASDAVGDWIVYYEPRRSSGDLMSRGGRQSYFAIARVTRIEEDTQRPDHFYAFVSDYMELDRPVPFREGEHYYEGTLRREDGGTSKGAFGRAVRRIPDKEYDLILQAGFAEEIERSDTSNVVATHFSEFAEDQATFDHPIIERMIARPFRDVAFSRHVKTAYDNTCAVTGLRLINGGGRSEVQAAHIRPVAASGPDSVRNGLALSGTVHWMFDRGLISINDDYRIIVNRDNVPDAVSRMINADGHLRLPSSPDLRPHPQFLRYHREQVFKG
ncbi:MAG: restriction endonuclease [Rhodospirillales bacterium RIFCSPLOWO2_02_FULL_58_16]|nr:MAG: restriction endonuclease [Rhodospirillales bacterium RIFCSPLOWO2_02_FULL_58_16]